MKEDVQTFSYTEKRKSYLTVVGTLLFFISIESSVVALLVIVLVHLLLLKLALLIALVCLLCFMVVRLLVIPLRTQHILTHTQLSVRYGFAFRADIARDDLIEARAVHERITMFQPMTSHYEEKRQRIIASFSEQGQVLLRLNKLHAFTMNHKIYIVDTLLINVDKRDEFLQALGMSGNSLTITTDAHKGRPYYTRLAQHTENIVGTPLVGVHASQTPAQLPLKDVPTIRIEKLTRRFGTSIVVDRLDMTIQSGEIYGFLGSNGAGKTTTMKMLVGLLQPDAGHAWLAGHDIEQDTLAAKASIGYVADRSILYERLTGREFLRFLGQIRDIPPHEAEKRISHLLEILELIEYADQLCGSYSFGMKRKLSLAGALIHQPQVLILDEPLNGLDPQSSRNLKDLLLDLASHGTTILLSTHDLATAEALCQRIGILYKGRLLAEGSVSELRQHLDAPDLEAVFLTLTAQAKKVVTI